jgi:hypothetical protein
MPNHSALSVPTRPHLTRVLEPLRTDSQRLPAPDFESKHGGHGGRISYWWCAVSPFKLIYRSCF